MIAASSLALLLVLAQTTTIFNTTIVRVDRAGRTIAVRVDGAQGDADRNRTRQLVVAPSAVASLATLKAGARVLLTLRGDTVVDIKLTAGSGGGGSSAPAYSGAGRRPPGASSPAHRGVPQLPASVDPPQGRPVPQVAPPGGRVITASPSPMASPPGVAPTRPAVSPVAVRSPVSPGTPKPVVLPSDPPPTPIP